MVSDVCQPNLISIVNIKTTYFVALHIFKVEATGFNKSTAGDVAV
jgi:hypothetical protein